MAAASSSSSAIDEKLYSRQLYVMGAAAQSRVQQADVLVVGLRGAGCEVAKNVILMGVRSVTLHDPAPTQWDDLSAQFYLRPADVGAPRAAACAPALAALNPYVKVAVHEGGLSAADVARFAVVVAADQPLRESLRLAAAARAGGAKFVLAEARGAFARVFCDFGDAFTVDDVTGEPPLSCLVTGVTCDAVGTVTVSEDARHGLSDGDCVTFSEVQGMGGLNGCAPRAVAVTGPYSFTIGDKTGLGGPHVRGGIVTQVKQPATLRFKPLAAMLGALTPDELLPADFGKLDALPALHAGWQQLHSWMEAEGGGAPPTPGRHDTEAVAAQVVGAVAAALGDAALPGSPSGSLVRSLARTFAGQLSPVTSAVGGIAGQEVLKAASGKFSPLRGWLYFDVAEALPAAPLPASETAPRGCRYDGQIAVFGATAQGALGRLRYFLVGAGAIGCEMLKNWAMMGVGCGGDEGGDAPGSSSSSSSSDGSSGPGVLVTDMDTIEKSNLSRQFLFRAGDIGAGKAVTACRAARAMNPALRTVAHEARLGPDSEGTFGDAFWGSLSGVCTALDNVDARMYTDGRCVHYGLPLLESGTLGTKGNTQVVVPRLTENYGASRDPPEQGIPVCTLKNFPFKPEHTLAWARDWFEGELRQTPDAVNAYLSDPGVFLEALAKQQTTRIDTLERIKAALVDARPTSVHDCVAWARRAFASLFHNSIAQLLHNFPATHLTSTGEPFWSGPKRAPSPLAFDPSDALHAAFIHAAARLLAGVFGIPVDASHTPAALAAIAGAVPVPAFSPVEGLQIAANDKELEEQKKAAADATAAAAAAGGAGGSAGGGASWDVEARAQALVDALPPPRTLPGFRLRPVEFEKDDDAHIALVAAASNLRSRNYAIAEADTHTARGIAGRIIPAIATTTAAVAGLVCAELYKLHGCPGDGAPKPLGAFRNAYVNLALPLFSFSEPMPVPVKALPVPAGSSFVPPAGAAALVAAAGAGGSSSSSGGGGGGGDDVAMAGASAARVWRWSLWDRLELPGPMTLRQLIGWFRETLGLDVQMLSYGATILYAFYLKPAVRNGRLDRPLGSLAEAVSKRALPRHAAFLSLEVVAVDAGTHEDVDLPGVRYQLGPAERREADPCVREVGTAPPRAPAEAASS